MLAIVMGLTKFRILSAFYLPAAFIGGYAVDPIYFKIGVVLGIVAALSDLEGYLARWFDCVTEYGGKLDVFADKVLCYTLSGIGWAIMSFDVAFVPMLAIVLGYDMYGWHRRRKGWIPPCNAGKAKTFVLMVALIAMTWSTTGWLPGLDSVAIAFWLMFAASALSIWSALHATWPKAVPDMPHPARLLAFARA